MNIVPLGPDAGRQVLKAIKEQHIVALLCDRDIEGTGVEVDFFGEPTRFPAGPAKLAVETGAALLPIHSWYEPRDSRLDLYGPLDTSSGDVAAITQALADRFATCIAAHPADWHMLQPQWIADLSEERRSRLAGDGIVGESGGAGGG
jgi:KDO2-lipid IV(A) lauroyltransferase